MRRVCLFATATFFGAYAWAASATETIKYSYDAYGRVTKVERTGTVNNGVKVEYIHDKVDNRAQSKTPASPNN